MSYVILDLEWNSAYSHSNHCFINEIIEFGAVKTDDVGIEIGDILAKHRIDGKLQPCADNAEDGIPDKTWMSAINLFQFHGFPL